MQFRCLKKNIIKAIGVTENVVEGKVVYNMESNILINLENDILTLTATDGNVWARSKMVLEDAKGGGTVAVYAKKIGSILKEMPEGYLSIRIETNEKIYIESETARTKHLIIGMKADDYPQYPADIDGANFISIPTKEFVTMISKTMTSIAKEPFKPALRGIYFEKVGSSLYAVATDGRRLAFIERDFDLKDSPDFNVIIEPKVLLEIQKNVNYEEIEEIQIGIDKYQVYFKVGQYDFVATLIEGKYPDYRKVIPKDYSYTFRVNKNDLIDAMRHVIPMISDVRSKKMIFDISTDMLRIKAVNQEMGESVEEIEAKYSGSDETTAFNYAYIMDVLRALDSEIITFCVNNDSTPTMIREIEREDYYFIIMPMNINEEA